MILNKISVVPIHWQSTSLEASPISNIPSFGADKDLNVFSIIHETSYKYSSTIHHSKHLFRLQPVVDIWQTVLSYELSASVEEGEVCNFTGVFGNYASFLEIKRSYTELSLIGRSTVCVQSPSQRMDLLHQPRTLPMVWMPWDRIMLQAYLQPPELPESELFALADYAVSFAQKNHNDVFAVLNDMNETIYREYSYVPGSTSLFTTPYQIYVNRKGVCQDFATLLICLARLLGIPARYRMGYLYTYANYQNTIQSDATHAWVEIYLPYAGWIGFDPTNGCLAGKNHIRVACGRYFNDATPTSGTIFQAEPGIQESLSTSVQVLLLNK